MARIRTIKPEFWTSEQVVECSTSARLLFIGMWNFVDDAGRMPASVMRLKMQVFPGDGFTKSDMDALMGELIDAGLVEQYETEGVAYWQVTGWHHQKIDRASIRYPGKPEDTSSSSRGYVEPSSNARRGVVEDTSNDRRALDEGHPPEWNGMEGNGIRVSDPTDLISADVSHPALADLPNGVLDFAFPMQADCWWMPAKKLAEYTADYPWPVEPELRKAAAWLRENRKRRPRSPTGVKQFLTRWLNRHDDDLRNRGSPDKDADIDAWLDSLDLGEEDDTP